MARLAKVHFVPTVPNCVGAAETAFEGQPICAVGWTSLHRFNALTTNANEFFLVDLANIILSTALPGTTKVRILALMTLKKQIVMEPKRLWVAIKSGRFVSQCLVLVKRLKLEPLHGTHCHLLLQLVRLFKNASKGSEKADGLRAERAIAISEVDGSPGPTLLDSGLHTLVVKHMPARQRQRRRLTQVLRATNGTLVGHDLIDFAGSTGGGSGLAVITHAGKTFLLTLIAVAKVSTAVHFGAAVGEFARTLFVITNLRRYRPIGQRQLIASRDATGAKSTLGRIQISFVLITGETHVVGSNTAIAAKIDLAIATDTLEATLQIVFFSPLC